MLRKIYFKSIKNRLLIANMGVLIVSSCILMSFGLIGSEKAIERTTEDSFRELVIRLGENIQNA